MNPLKSINLQFLKSKRLLLLPFISILLFLLNYKYLSRLIKFDLKLNITDYPVRRNCIKLQKRIDDILLSERKDWSVTVLDQKRNIISDINSTQLFIPASNQKLLSTAYALDKLGTNFKLTTKLVKRTDGVLELWGQGDPDLNDLDIKNISKAASEAFTFRILNNKVPKIIIYEEPSTNWWPDTWHTIDRLESYGSPITRLAITSNSNDKSVQNPISRLNNSLTQEMSYYGFKPELITKDYNTQSSFFLGRRVIKKIESAPMISLLSLANSESHNFTAEMLIRHAADTWNSREAATRLKKWLHSKNIPVDQFVLVDGSGLSRKNKVTTLGIASLLWHMDTHQHSNFYKSSMAVAGIRGTLNDFNIDSALYGRFYGKTGTLTGVRAVSGILDTETNVRYVSIINNNGYHQDPKIRKILEVIYRFSQCD